MATNPSCPISHEFRPFDTDFAADPYPFYGRLREETAVAYVPDLNLYLVSRYDDISSVLKDRETFSAANATVPFNPIAPAAQAILESGFPRKPTFTNADPPRHPLMRRAASQCMTRERFAASQPQLREFVEARIAEIANLATVDLAAELIFPTTARAGFMLLGFPREDTQKLLAWCGKRVQLTYGKLSVEDQVIAAQQLVDFWAYCRDFVRMRMREPADDLTTDLLALSRKDDQLLSTEDVDNMVYSLALASHETSANAISNGVLRLMKERDVWQTLLRDRSLVPNAVEELMRFDSPTLTHRRLTTREAEIGGVKIPAGATVLLMLAAGNHDPRQFPDPETIDVKRGNAGTHLAFGRYWHFCLGAPLARFEYALILDRLLDRLPKMALITEAPINYTPLILIRGPDKLMIYPNGHA